LSALAIVLIKNNNVVGIENMQFLRKTEFIYVVFALNLLVNIAYFYRFANSKYQTTPGKMLMRIKTVESMSNSYLHEFIKEFMQIIGGFIFFVGFLLVMLFFL